MGDGFTVDNSSADLINLPFGMDGYILESARSANRMIISMLSEWQIAFAGFDQHMIAPNRYMRCGLDDQLLSFRLFDWIFGGGMF